MQERHMDAIASKAFGKRFSEQFPNGIPDADIIKRQTTNLPAGTRTPSDEEIKEMQDFAISYKAKNKKASKREVRRAITRKFNVQILPNTINY